LGLELVDLLEDVRRKPLDAVEFSHANNALIAYGSLAQDAELNHGNRPWGKQPPTALQ
jgi:hypothetical protein